MEILLVQTLPKVHRQRETERHVAAKLAREFAVVRVFVSIFVLNPSIQTNPICSEPTPIFSEPCEFLRC